MKDTIEELVQGVPDGNKSKYDDLLHHMSPEGRDILKYREFRKFEGGTDKLMDLAYDSIKEDIMSGAFDLAGMKGPSASASLLERIASEIAGKSGISDIKAWFEITKKKIDQDYKDEGPEVKKQEWFKFLVQYVGADQKQLGALIGLAENLDDKYSILDPLKNFKESMKDSLIDFYNNKKITQYSAEDEAHFKAYMIKESINHGKESIYLGKEFEKRPDEIAGELQNVKFQKYQEKIKNAQAGYKKVKPAEDYQI